MKQLIDVEQLRVIINTDMIPVKDRLFPMNAFRRNREILYSRYVAFHFLYGIGWSYNKIGTLFNQSGRNGCLNHSTIINGIKQYRMLNENKQFYSDFVEINNIVYPLLVSCIIPQMHIDTSNMTEIEKKLIDCNTLDDFMQIKAVVLQKSLMR